MTDNVRDAFDCSIPLYGQRLRIFLEESTNILKFPPTKNWRPMMAGEVDRQLGVAGSVLTSS